MRADGGGEADWVRPGIMPAHTVYGLVSLPFPREEKSKGVFPVQCPVLGP